ncbi:transmembrane 7 superfamily member 3-like [Prorops nasuta]|uniref:transmembrane 7 superfamily member 3-like n=1 Tax=Prorops nasuta TaxID=863751 RepID=UPI0034CD3364
MEYTLLMMLSFLMLNTFEAQDTTVLSPDRNTTKISLVNNTDQNPFTKRISLEPSNQIVFNIIQVPKDIHFIIAQIHTYNHNVSLSYSKEQIRTNFSDTLHGTNIGLFKNTVQEKSVDLYVTNDNALQVEMLLVVTLYDEFAPIPGGCNMEFETEIAPYQKVTLGNGAIIVDAQPASSPLTNQDHNSCQNLSIQYDAYRMYLPEGDWSIDTYFNSIKKMLVFDDVINNAQKISASTLYSPMRRIYSAYFETGSVYVMIATQNKYSSLYVSTVSYGCDPLNLETCKLINSSFAQFLCVMTFLLGLFAVAYGHKIFKLDMFVTIYFVGAIAGYIIAAASGNTSHSARIGTGIGVGLLFGFSSLIMWHCKIHWALHNLTIRLSFGLLIASIFYYCAPDSAAAIQTNWSFWFIYFVIIIVTLMITHCFCIWTVHQTCQIVVRTITCAIYGSFMIILSLDYWIGGNLKYIVINLIRRACEPGFNYAIIRPPHQSKDICLIILWIFLAVWRTIMYIKKLIKDIARGGYESY